MLEEDRRTGTTIIPINDERAKGLAPLAPGAKKSDTRRARDLSTDDLRDLLFSLFERKHRWTLKDLVAETRQPHVSGRRLFNLILGAGSLMTTCCSSDVARKTAQVHEGGSDWAIVAGET